MWLLVKHIMPDAPSESIKIVFVAIQAEYHAQQVPSKDRYPSLKWGFFRVMGIVFRQFCDMSDTRHIRILDGIKAMSETNQDLFAASVCKSHTSS